jgi:hypothetical protein
LTPTPRPRLALIHSPLTSALVWRGVADVLATRGVVASCVRLPESQHLQPPYWLVHAATAAEALPDDGAIVLVAHSGAGVLLPAIARFAINRTRSARIAGCVFVDCDLPRDGRSRFELMDAESAADLRRRCRDGWLPRWTPEQLERFIGDAALRDAFAAELPRVPIEMYDEAIPVPDGWPEMPVAYLELSPFYRDAVGAARRAGWPLRSLAVHHLAPLTEPTRIADALLELMREIELPPAMPNG